MTESTELVESVHQRLVRFVATSQEIPNLMLFHYISRITAQERVETLFVIRSATARVHDPLSLSLLCIRCNCDGLFSVCMDVHLGASYCQKVSALVKTQELMASFPLSQRPFAPLERSEAERRRFHTQATELLGNALKEYEEFALIRHHQVDRRRWKPVKSHENLSVYRESRSYAINRSLSVEDEEPVARAAAPTTGSRRRVSRSSSSSGGSNSISTIHELPAHQVTELELLTGWGPTATEAREQKKRAKSRSVSARGNLEQLPSLLGVGNIIGSLDDVMYGVAAPDCASMALKNAYAHDDVLDGDVLSAVEGPSQRSPFRFLGIKWMVKSSTGTAKHKLVSPRDLVYLEATGVITRGDGVRIGYQIMHSVKLKGCPELYESHGVVRARCESVHLFVELNSKTVDVFLKSNVTPNGKISESAALQSCANSLLYCGKTVQCSQNKKLMWRLDCNASSESVRRQKMKATQCSVCSKTFGRFLRQSIECKLCSAAMCSKCCVERSLKSVDVSGNKRHVSKFVSTTVAELCTTCVATTIQTSALMIAREEVMAGRFGRVARSSMLPPSLRRGSEGSCASVATISIEDIPGQREHRVRPPRQSEKKSRRGHRPQYSEEARRGHREQGSYRDDPVADDDSGRGYQSRYHDAPVSERRGRAYRGSLPTNSRQHADRELQKIRTRAGSRPELVPTRHQVLRRGYSAEAYQEIYPPEDIEGVGHYERYTPEENILRGRHHSAYSNSPVELDNSGKGIPGTPVGICDLDDVSPYTSSKESIRKTTSSSGSSFEGIHTAIQEPEAEDDVRDSFESFDSFGDFIDIRDELDDIDETLDTKDMEAVKRASQVNRKLWEQIADLRDVAENVYQYTKESTAMHMTRGGSIRSPPVRPTAPGHD